MGRSPHPSLDKAAPRHLEREARWLQNQRTSQTFAERVSMMRAFTIRGESGYGPLSSLDLPRVRFWEPGSKSMRSTDIWREWNRQATLLTLPIVQSLRQQLNDQGEGREGNYESICRRAEEAAAEFLASRRQASPLDIPSQLRAPGGAWRKAPQVALQIARVAPMTTELWALLCCIPLFSWPGFPCARRQGQ